MKRKLMTLLLMITMILSMASCGGFIMQEETIEIESIVPTLLEDGQTKIVITYKNNMQEPTVFYLPKGEDGIEGVGIESIENAEAEVEGNTAFEIVLTSGETKKIEVPNGVSIVDTTTITKEEDGKNYLVVYFSNGETDEVEIMPGPAGKDGFTSVEIESQEEVKDITNPYNGFIKIVFLFSDSAGERQERKEIYVRPGKTGNGILSIYDKFDDENGRYYIIIEESNGNVNTFEFPVSQWFSGKDVPGDSLGQNGDFYFNTSDGIVYRKVNDVWGVICNLLVDNSQKNKCKIILHLNNGLDEINQAKYKEEDEPGWRAVSYGSNLYSCDDSLPVPERDGYEFAGWYTTPNPKIVHGVFTDLTTVTTDVNLYAKWIKID